LEVRRGGFRNSFGASTQQRPKGLTMWPGDPVWKSPIAVETETKENFNHWPVGRPGSVKSVSTGGGIGDDSNSDRRKKRNPARRKIWEERRGCRPTATNGSETVSTTILPNRRERARDEEKGPFEGGNDLSRHLNSARNRFELFPENKLSRGRRQGCEPVVSKKRKALGPREGR